VREGEDVGDITVVGVAVDVGDSVPEPVGEALLDAVISREGCLRGGGKHGGELALHAIVHLQLVE
jgi:hypothetical protein